MPSGITTLNHKPLRPLVKAGKKVTAAAITRASDTNERALKNGERVPFRAKTALTLAAAKSAPATQNRNTTALPDDSPNIIGPPANAAITAIAETKAEKTASQI